MIDYRRYMEVLGRWRGGKAAYFRPIGNMGDRLIDEGMGQLARVYGIELTSVSRADVVFWAGGGNMGTLYPEAARRRRQAWTMAQERGVPFVILPQSWNAPDEGRFDFAFVRERLSMVHCPEAVLAPDIGLAYRPDFEIPAAAEEEGWFFRGDKEKRRRSEDQRSQREEGDPVRGVTNVRQYVLRAAKFARLHTDRAHFALAGLIAGREVTLYANSYHKNEGLAGEWGREFASLKFSVFREEGDPPGAGLPRMERSDMDASEAAPEGDRREAGSNR